MQRNPNIRRRKVLKITGGASVISALGVKSSGAELSELHPESCNHAWDDSNRCDNSLVAQPFNHSPGEVRFYFLNDDKDVAEIEYALCEGTTTNCDTKTINLNPGDSHLDYMDVKSYHEEWRIWFIDG